MGITIQKNYTNSMKIWYSIYRDDGQLLGTLNTANFRETKPYHFYPVFGKPKSEPLYQAEIELILHKLKEINAD